MQKKLLRACNMTRVLVAGLLAAVNRVRRRDQASVSTFARPVLQALMDKATAKTAR